MNHEGPVALKGPGVLEMVNVVREHQYDYIPQSLLI